MSVSHWSYGQYAYFCQNIPSVATCNLFFRQLLPADDQSGVGINSACAIPNRQANDSVGNVADIVVSGISVLVALWLAGKAFVRVAAVARIEFSALMVTYALTYV